MKLKYIFINTILFVLLASTSFAAYDDQELIILINLLINGYKTEPETD